MMLQYPHVVPKTAGTNATIKYGKAGGIASGTWWEAGVKTNGDFQIFKEDNINNGGILLKSNGGMDISGNLNINNGDLYVKGFKTNNSVKFDFTPIDKDPTTNKFIFNINLNAYIPNIDNVRVFNLYAWHSPNQAVNIDNIFSGAYVFTIYNFSNPLQRRQTIYELGGGATITITDYNTLKFSGDTNTKVSVVLNLLS